MQVRDWLLPPRQLLVAFLAVALVSAAALGWLGWLLLEQDKALDVQRQRERIEQAADRAAAVLQRSLADLQSFVGREFEGDASPPPGVVTISLTPDGRVAAPQGQFAARPCPRKLEFDANRVRAGAGGRIKLHADGRQLVFVSGNKLSMEAWVLENFLPALRAKK